MHDKPDHHDKQDQKHHNRDDLFRKLGHDSHKDAQQKEIVDRLTSIHQLRHDPNQSGFYTFLQSVEALFAAHLVSYPFVALKTRAQLGFSSNFKTLKELGPVGSLKGSTPYLHAAWIRGAIQQIFVPSGKSQDPKKPQWKRFLSSYAPLVFGFGLNTVAENIQTKIIHDAALGQNRLAGVGSIVSNIYATQGWKGIFRGFVPQSGSYGIFIAGNFLASSTLKIDSTPYDIFFKAFLPVNIVCSILANPLEVVKTQFQSLEGHNVNFNQVVAKEGIKNLLTKGLGHFMARNVAFSLIFVTLFSGK